MIVEGQCPSQSWVSWQPGGCAAASLASPACCRDQQPARPSAARWLAARLLPKLQVAALAPDPCSGAAVAPAPPPPPPGPPAPPQVTAAPGALVGFTTLSSLTLRTSAIGGVLAAVYGNATTALLRDLAFKLTNAASPSSSSTSGDMVKLFSMEAARFCR
jgi:hypothetical protein